MSPQARGSAGGRRRHDPASQEDHDKPYVCDSKYRHRRLPFPAPALTPVPTIPVLPCLSAPSPGLLAPPPGPTPPLCHHLLSALMFLQEESKWEALGAVLLSRAGPFVAFLCRFHSVSLRSLFLSLLQRITNKNISQNPPTRVLGSCGLSFVSL